MLIIALLCSGGGLLGLVEFDGFEQSCLDFRNHIQVLLQLGKDISGATIESL